MRRETMELKRKRGPMKVRQRKSKKKTKFQEYLDMEMGQHFAGAQEDAALERRLTQKLGLKKGRLTDVGDGLTDLLGDFGEFDAEIAENGEDSSAEENDEDLGASDQKASSGEENDEDTGDSENSSAEGDSENEEVSENEKHSEGSEEASEHDSEEESMEQAKIEQERAVKYIPPHQRAAKAPSEEEIRLRRRIKGLLNRLSEDNVETITSEVAGTFETHSRKLVTDTITKHVLESCCNGPRGNEQYAAVFAGFIAGLACLVGMDIGAIFMVGVASHFEEQNEKQDGLAARNLTLLISSLYNLNLISSELVYDFLQHLCKRFNEIDVATILHIIKSCGMGLRSIDPSSMKDFIICVHQRTSELKKSLSDEGNEGLNKRVEFMLEAICEVKNNKRKDEPQRHTRMRKWLQKLRVEDVQIRSMTWKKLLDPTKKGQWWLGTVSEDAGEYAPKVVKNLIDSGAADAEKMLKLAAAQRMNTDARRGIFSIVMSGEDYVDAFEKLLRLNLTGKQDREIMRVIVECCLQEKVFNKYYALLASKFCHHDKNHKFTLQYCIWDHFKELENMAMRRSMNLAQLLAFLIGSSALSLTVLKAVDFGDPRYMTAKVIVHFRSFFETLLSANDEGFIMSAFSRISELTALRSGLLFFLRRYVSQKISATGSALHRNLNLARKALSSYNQPFNQYN